MQPSFPAAVANSEDGGNQARCNFVSQAAARGDRAGTLRGRAAALPHTSRAIIIFLISAMALAGFRPFGHTLAQFMIVWQR